MKTEFKEEELFYHDEDWSDTEEEIEQKEYDREIQELRDWYDRQR